MRVDRQHGVELQEQQSAESQAALASNEQLSWFFYKQVNYDKTKV